MGFEEPGWGLQGRWENLQREFARPRAVFCPRSACDESLKLRGPPVMRMSSIRYIIIIFGLLRALLRQEVIWSSRGMPDS